MGLGFLGGGSIGASQFGGRPIGSRRLRPTTPRWGTEWKRANADCYPHSMALGIQGSCYPNTENYLDLDSTYTDAYGQPLIRMNFDWRENELRMSKFVTQKMADIAKAIDADITGPANPLHAPFDTRIYNSAHITGSTIMGAKPTTSVVLPHLQHWDVQNLFILGVSVFAHTRPATLAAAGCASAAQDDATQPG